MCWELTLRPIEAIARKFEVVTEDAKYCDDSYGSIGSGDIAALALRNALTATW
jgi:hypothetical protein